jgi:hypothetical protein
VSFYREAHSSVMHLRGRPSPGQTRVVCRVDDEEIMLREVHWGEVVDAVLSVPIGYATLRCGFEPAVESPAAPNWHHSPSGASPLGGCQPLRVVESLRDEDGSLTLFFDLRSDELRDRPLRLRFSLDGRVVLDEVLPPFRRFLRLPPSFRADRCELDPDGSGP